MNKPPSTRFSRSFAPVVLVDESPRVLSAVEFANVLNLASLSVEVLQRDVSFDPGSDLESTLL